MGRVIKDWATKPGETPIDPSRLLSKHKKVVKTEGQLALVEAENIRKAHVKYLTGSLARKKVPFDVQWMCQLHKEMYGDVWEWAGIPKRGDLPFGVPKEQIQGEFYALSRDIECWPESEMGVLEQSAYLHYRAVRVHPFPNGNGRWARLLANIWLRLNKHPIVDWPTEVRGTESSIRQEYLKAVRAAYDDVDIEPLLELHERFSVGSQD